MKVNLEASPTNSGRLVSLIKQLGHNRELFIEAGIVVSELPDLKIEVDGGIILEGDDLIVARQLLPRVDNVTLRPRHDSYISFGSSDVSESMSAEGMGPHVHDVTQITLDNVQNDFLAQSIEIVYESPLRLGDRVLIIADDDTDEYFVIDRLEELDDYQERYETQKYIDNEGE